VTPPESPGRDPLLTIVAVVVGCLLATGLGLLGAAAVSMAGARSPGPAAVRTDTASPTPTTAPSATPTPSVVQPTVSPGPRNVGEAPCAFGDFPVYPGSTPISNPTANGRRWWVNTYPTQVADYFSAGVGPSEWLFRPEPVNGSPWRFRVTRPPACRGFLTVLEDPSGGTQYEAIPDGY
jgi:hypothetical protein